LATGVGSLNPDLPESARRPSALRAARHVAMQNAIKAVKGMYLNGSTKIETGNETIPKVTKVVTSFLRDAKVRDLVDGSVEVSMEIPLERSGLSGLLLGTNVMETPAITSFDGKKAKKDNVYSGLIVDCRGIEIKPALNPRVLDESGREIYGSAYIAKKWALQRGIVRYTTDIQRAMKLNGRIGATPLQTKALKVYGENQTDVVIPNDAAAKLRSSSKNLQWLSECRVVFVIDGP